MTMKKKVKSTCFYDVIKFLFYIVLILIKLTEYLVYTNILLEKVKLICIYDVIEFLYFYLTPPIIISPSELRKFTKLPNLIILTGVNFQNLISNRETIMNNMQPFRLLVYRFPF